MQWYVVWKEPGESKCRWVRGEDGGWIRALAENARRAGCEVRIIRPAFLQAV
jgi:hypothetical protein